MNIKSAFKVIGNATKKHSPAILTGLTVVGVIAATYHAYKAGLVASEILENHRIKMEQLEKEDKAGRKAVRKETVKKMAPVVASMVVMGAVTCGCAIGAQSISSRRIAALSAAYSISEAALNDLNLKMKEMLGDKKARAIKDSIAKDKLHAAGPVNESQIIITGSGDVRCMDEYTGRLFLSNAIKIDKAINKLNNDIRCCRYVSLNDFYDLIGLARVPMGNDLGWNEEDTLGDGRLPISFTAILDDDNNPVLCIEYDIHLRDDYRNLH